MRANISLAAFPGLRHADAASLACRANHSEPLIGLLCTDHIQFVPQNFGVLTHDLASDIVSSFPGSRFRLHANVRVLRETVPYDLSSFNRFPAHWKQAAHISRNINASAYSAHAGTRAEASFAGVIESARRAADLFNCPVAVEGHYPSRREGDKYNVSTWGEHRSLFESSVPYALDLSHLNIVATQTRSIDLCLVKEMLASDFCIEIHLSDNDGSGDQHQTLSTQPWWWNLRDGFNPNAVVFSEGNQKRKLKND
jgi:hypothetical protein